MNKTNNSHAQIHDSSEELPRNEFDSFLDFNDDSQLGIGMNMNMNLGMDNGDGFFAEMN